MMIAAIKTGIKILESCQEDYEKLDRLKDQAADAKEKAQEAYQAYFDKNYRSEPLETREEKMRTDKQLKKLWDDWLDKRELLVKRIPTEMNRVIKEARECRDSIRDNLNDLEAYVTKKEKEKKHFWQKTSVSSAKKFIKNTRVMLDL